MSFFIIPAINDIRLFKIAIIFKIFFDYFSTYSLLLGLSRTINRYTLNRKISVYVNSVFSTL